MFNSYVKILFRNLAKAKVYAGISILSLSMGITAALMIFIYIQRELSYDHFYNDADDIYRMGLVRKTANSVRKIGFMPLALGPYLKQNYESVLQTVRIFQYRRAIPVSIPETRAAFNEEGFAWADSTFFEVFNQEFLRGDPATALDGPNSVVITESTARKYFQDGNPIGRRLQFNWEYDQSLVVTGVIKDFPSNSHFKFDLISSLVAARSFMWSGRDWLNSWGNLFVSSYVKLKPGTDIGHFKPDITERVKEGFNNPNATYEPFFQPITNIHLYSDLDVGEWEAITNPQNLYMFGAIGCIILFLGCFNFTNMITAQAGKRAKEIGLRKVFGSKKWQLVQQHYFETFLYAFLALIISFVSSALVSGQLSKLTGQDYPFEMFISIEILGALGIILAIVCVIAGTYPALFISGFSPITILHSSRFSFKSSGSIRNTLVVTQFVISICLIICTILVNLQLDYMQNKQLGFKQDVILNIPIQNDDAILPKLETFRSALTNHHSITGVTSASHIFFANYTYVNQFQVDGVESSTIFRWERYTVDHDYIETFGLEMVAGRGFSRSYASDSSAFILNEAAVKVLGLTPEEAIGRKIDNVSDRKSGVIVGVVKDFHYRSLHQEIQPFVLYINLDRLDYFSVALQPGQLEDGLDHVERTWEALYPGIPYFSEFQDQHLASYYQREENMSKLFSWFTVVALFLASLGLFGFASYTSESRFKEIGIRKVLGANSSQITQLLTREFLKLVLLAYVLAIPLAYYAMGYWLESFAFRIDQPLWVFVAAGFATLLISFVTVAQQSLKTAWANPIIALKTE